jgi:hypothetical protein
VPLNQAYTQWETMHLVAAAIKAAILGAEQALRRGG